MKPLFAISPTRQAIVLALLAWPVFSAEPFPALPPTMSTSVTPNVLLHIDNSGSMANYPSGSSNKTKMEMAKEVASALVKNNPDIRWGIFSFDPKNNETAGILQAPIGSTSKELQDAIGVLGPDTWTPLGEALFEMTRYWSGEESYYKKTKNTINGFYSSPIQYRCQKNFNLIITDGVSTKDNKIPGLPKDNSENYNGIIYTSYDTNNNKITKTFKACTGENTPSNSSISCPKTLEGSGSNRNFIGTKDDSASYGTAIRDVAMYAYDKDMRVGGIDEDGVSFDDAKFAKQNVITYTVGFDVDDPVLWAAAEVGGGKYYATDSNTGRDLGTVLKNAINDILSSISNAGGVATSSEISKADNQMYQPVFNPNGWYGELRC